MDTNTGITVNSVKVVVFDFDGTLVDSNKVKYESFFELFPPGKHYRKVISDILNELPEESRYVILELILKRLGYDGEGMKSKVIKLAKDYDDMVVSGVKNCNEKPGATDLLEAASKKYHLYLNSNTPQVSLSKIVDYRSWTVFFQGLYGYPCGKESALRKIIKLENVNPGNILVVGDGQSDKLAALNTLCQFYMVRGDNALLNLRRLLNK